MCRRASAVFMPRSLSILFYSFFVDSDPQLILILRFLSDCFPRKSDFVVVRRVFLVPFCSWTFSLFMNKDLFILYFVPVLSSNCVYQKCSICCTGTVGSFLVLLGIQKAILYLWRTKSQLFFVWEFLILLYFYYWQGILINVSILLLILCFPSVEAQFKHQFEGLWYIYFIGHSSECTRCGMYLFIFSPLFID